MRPVGPNQSWLRNEETETETGIGTEIGTMEERETETERGREGETGTETATERETETGGPMIGYEQFSTSFSFTNIVWLTCLSGVRPFVEAYLQGSVGGKSKKVVVMVVFQNL